MTAPAFAIVHWTAENYSAKNFIIIAYVGRR